MTFPRDVVAKDMVLWRDQVLAREVEEEVDRLSPISLTSGRVTARFSGHPTVSFWTP